MVRWQLTLQHFGFLCRGQIGTRSSSNDVTQLWACVPANGNAVALASEHVAGGRAPADERRTTRSQRTIDALGATQAKLEHRLFFGCLAHARCLGGHERLEVDEIEQRGLE